MRKKTYEKGMIKFDSDPQFGDTFGSVLCRFMKDFGCTEAELADAIGVDISAVKKYKSNSYKPAVPNLIKICLALHLFYERSIYLISLSGKKLPDGIKGEQYKWALGIIFYKDWNIDECSKECMNFFNLPNDSLF